MNKIATIVIPTFNAGSYLMAALESALRQTYRPLEILIVDDGSTDDSIRALSNLEDSRVRLIQQVNAGKSVAMNRALGELSGAYYCILDADDEMHPERVARQVRALEENPDLAGVFCGHELLIGEHHLAPRMRFRDRIGCRLSVEKLQMPAHDPTGMYRVAMVESVDYEPSLRIGEGYDYILRIGEQWPLMVLEECLYTYRVRRGSLTRGSISIENRRCVMAMVKRRAAQRRGLDSKLEDLSSQPVTNRDKDNNLAAHFIESVADLRQRGRWSEAFSTAFYCLRMHPLDLHYWKPLAVGTLPKLLVDFLRS